MGPHPSQRPAETNRPWWTISLENVIALGLCMAVVLGSAAVIETDRLISSSLLRGDVDRPAQEKRPLDGIRRLEVQTNPDVICVICIGGLRSDHVPFAEDADDAPDSLAPELQRLAAESVKFETACAQASHPLISLKSMLTGYYPSSLILEDTSRDQFSLSGLDAPGEFLRETFHEVSTTLAPRLRAIGYRTGFVTDARWCLDEAGLSADFDDSERVDREASHGRPVFRLGLDWLREHDDPKLFLFLHIEDLLGTVSGDLSRAKTVYDQRLHAVDGELGRFIAALRNEGIWERALVVLTSDHGTSLGERGMFGHGDLYMEQLRVPLLFKFPSDWHRPPAVIDEPVELVDLLPTLIAVGGDPIPRLDGSSLLPTIQRGVRGRRILVAQTNMRGHRANATVRTAMEPGRWQVIHDANNNRVEFFALGPDPAALRSVHPGDMNVPPFLSDLFTKNDVFGPSADGLGAARR